MDTSSYMELALTIYGWHVSNQLTGAIVFSGLIFLPLIFMVWRNWSEPARSQEAKAAAPVSQRRMEQDVALFFVTIILAFIPSVPLAVSDITMESGTNAAATDPAEVEYIPPAVDRIEVPVLWWVVHNLSSGFTDVFVAAIHSFREPTYVRTLSLGLETARIDDRSLAAELQQFDRDCWLPALARAERNPNARSPEWRGDTDILMRPQYYPSMAASDLVESWDPPYDFSGPGSVGPRCDEWWIGNPDRSLVPRLYANIEENLSGFQRWLVWRLGASGEADRQAQAVRKFLSARPPPAIDPGNPDHDAANWSPWAILGGIGSIAALPFVKVAMFVVVVGLPMLQSIGLMMIYVAIPVAIPFAVLRPGLIVFFVIAIFSLKFTTALWALAQVLDESLIDFMYGGANQRELVGSGTLDDLILSMIAAFSYIVLPVTWLWLMGSFARGTASGINALFAQSSGRLESISDRGIGAVTSVGKGLIR